eukprot:3076087-Ditylum_brightwellii.AAC.1
MDQLPHEKLEKAQQDLQSMLDLLDWLACGTRIDIATITSILVQHLSRQTPYHVAAEKYIIKYLKGCSKHGI